jgi:hypothetical protein
VRAGFQRWEQMDLTAVVVTANGDGWDRTHMRRRAGRGEIVSAHQSPAWAVYSGGSMPTSVAVRLASGTSTHAARGFGRVLGICVPSGLPTPAALRILHFSDYRHVLLRLRLLVQDAGLKDPYGISVVIDVRSGPDGGCYCTKDLEQGLFVGWKSHLHYPCVLDRGKRDQNLTELVDRHPQPEGTSDLPCQ